MVSAAWLVRAGRDGERESGALAEGLIIAGWDESGDLGHCSHKERVRETLTRSYPGESKATLANWTGQLWRLLHEIRDGDLVVLPRKKQQKIAVGRVAGPYCFRGEAEPGFQHVRPVEWIRTDVDRSAVCQDLLDSMGSLMTVCQIKRYGAARRIAHVAEHGADPGPAADELSQQGLGSAQELLDAAASRPPESPLRVSIRELLSCWGAARRTAGQVAQIEAELAENGLTSRPPFTEGWIDNSVEIVRVDEGTSEAAPEDGWTAAAEQDAFPAITLRVGMLRPASGGVARVRPDDVLDVARSRMVADNYSQLAVIDEDEHLHGAVSWETIGKAQLATSARQVCEVTAPVRAVDHHEDLLGQLDEIFRSGFVFVRGSDRRICGIVTTADLTAQFGDLARPFVLIEEVERRLRRRVDEVFSLDELQCTGRRTSSPRIGSAADLSLGKYGYLLDSPENWKRLEWPLDHGLFLERLEQVRRVRNDLMHFTPDPLQQEQLAVLEGLVRMLRVVDPRG